MTNIKTVDIFAPITKKMISFWVNSPKICFTAPDGNGVLAAKKIWQMVCWLNKEFIIDCKNISFTPTKTHKKYLDNESSRIRNFSRTISYIIQISLLERLVKKLYEDMCINLKKYADSTIKEDSREKGNRKKEMGEATTFRNKVAAHLSFYYPYDHKTKKNDNLSTQISSLNALLSCGTYGKSKLNFGIPGVSSIVGGENPSTQIPTIRVARLHPKMKKHFQAWTKMFLKELRKLKKKDIHLAKL
ncbi:MAG: hypothetical protein ABIH35_00160 [Patescibacteria group bacterium]